MTLCETYTRLRHALTAGHWRGSAVHSPFVYRFIREVVVPHRRSDLPQSIASAYAGRMASGSLVLIERPFARPGERRRIKAWFRRPETHATLIHLQGLLVIFLDPALQKEWYNVRN